MESNFASLIKNERITFTCAYCFLMIVEKSPVLVAVGCGEIVMEMQGSSRANPICMSDSPPGSTPVSPVKLLTKEKRPDCR